MKFKSRQNQSMVIEVNLELCWGQESVNWEKAQEWGTLPSGGKEIF